MVHCIAILSFCRSNQAFKSNQFYKYLQELQLSSERSKVLSVSIPIPNLLEKAILIGWQLWIFGEGYAENRAKTGKMTHFVGFRKAILPICP